MSEQPEWFHPPASAECCCVAKEAMCLDCIKGQHYVCARRVAGLPPQSRLYPTTGAAER